MSVRMDDASRLEKSDDSHTPSPLPLSREEVGDLLRSAAQGDFDTTNSVQLRLISAMDMAALPLEGQRARQAELNRIFVDNFMNGDVPGVVARIHRLTRQPSRIAVLCSTVRWKIDALLSQLHRVKS